jgi:hypothetical protein
VWGGLKAMAPGNQRAEAPSGPERRRRLSGECPENLRRLLSYVQGNRVIPSAATNMRLEMIPSPGE